MEEFLIFRSCDLDLDLGSGHTAYRCASLINLSVFMLEYYISIAKCRGDH